MANDWIKIREDLLTDPRVLTMAGMLSSTAASYVFSASARDLLGVTPTVTRDVMRDVTVTGLIRVWRAGNRHTVDGVFRHCDLSHIDQYAEIPGFGPAMQHVGYAIYDAQSQTVTLPNFLEHNAPAKAGKGSKGSERQRRYREKQREAEKAKASQQETKSDAFGDVTGDVTFLSKSISKSSSFPELETLKKRINGLSPAWTKTPHWGNDEEHALLEASANLTALTDQDWALLKWFRGKADHPSNGMDAKDELKLTSKRGQFVSDLGSILQRAEKLWRQLRCPPLGTTPPKPKTAVKLQEDVITDPREASDLFKRSVSS